MDKVSIQLALMAEGKCHYLPTEQERTSIVLDADKYSPAGYQLLLQAGFRRSGNMIYRPHCSACTACHSLRVDVERYLPNKSHKRQRSQLQRLTVRLSESLPEEWFALYQRYIEARHRNGSMYPANRNDFLSFTGSDWMDTQYLLIYQENSLIAVAVTDKVKNGLSALYSFFEPEHKWSLGGICIQAQIELAQKSKRKWLYLGYQIDQCDAMNYKAQYTPNQRYIGGYWQNSGEN